MHHPARRLGVLLLTTALALVPVLVTTTAPATAAAGDITTYPIAGDSSFGVTTGPDGNLWFTDSLQGRIHRVSPGGASTAFPAGGQPGGITAGPDGALWFTIGLGPPRIIRMSLDGTRTAFPTGHLTGDSIVVGADGALWFAAHNAVGRITTAGAISFFPLASPVAVVTRVTLGPDGNVWFTNADSVLPSSVGKVTPTGVVTEYPLPAVPPRDPIGITTGSDGALWFAEPGTSSIGRITASGALTEVAVPGSRPYDVVTGPDGALWFTEHDTHRIGRMGTSGALTHHELPAPHQHPAGITVGPDGALWFGLREGSVVGRIAVDGGGSGGPRTHQVTAGKAEAQVDLLAGETRTVSVSCPVPGDMATDGAVRVDHVDQGGAPVDVRVLQARSTAVGDYTFTVHNAAPGRAQAKAFVTCLSGRTTTAAGHDHPLVLSSAVTATAVGSGLLATTVGCHPGQVVTAPGIHVTAGGVRVLASEPSPDLGSWAFTFAADPGTVVQASVRCLDDTVGPAQGHTHDLGVDHVARRVSVAAGATVTESVTCPQQSGGITASHTVPTGVLLLGHDPRPVSRAFRLQNTTAAPLEVLLDLVCVHDRTGADRPPGGGPTPHPVSAARVRGSVAYVAGRSPLLRVELRCGARAACRGKVTLRAPRALLATTRYRLAADADRKLSLEVGPRARRLLASGSVTSVRVTFTRPAGPPVTQRVRLTTG